MKQWSFILILVLLLILTLPSGILAGIGSEELLTSEQESNPTDYVLENPEQEEEFIDDEGGHSETAYPEAEDEASKIPKADSEDGNSDLENPPMTEGSDQESGAEDPSASPQTDDPDQEGEPEEEDELIDDEGVPSDRIIVTAEAFLYTAFDFYDKAQELVAAYPDLLKLDLLGHSADGRPVFALILAEGIRTRTYEEIYIQRYQLMMEAGNHSRETINPCLLMRTVEDYCLDVYDNQHIPGMDVAGILQQGTFHFLILTNPDGYDAVKHGVQAIRSNPLRQNLIQLLDGQSVSLLKAGIEGVDRNRNFEDEYYHVGTRRWINQFYTKNADSPKEPALEFYPGPYPASAIETQLVQNYVSRYPFRAFLSYHSMGRVIYYVKEYLPTSYNENVLRPFAEMAAAVTGYRTIHYVSSSSAGGYFTHFTVNLTQKPSLTVETTAVRSFPTPLEYYEEEYERVQKLPYRAMEYVIQKGFFPYRVYVGGKFFHDYQSEVYAQGVAQKFKGKVVTRVGEPVYEHIVVYHDGEKIPFTAESGAPFIVSGRTMLPVRRVAETLGAQVEWIQSLYQAEIYWDDNRIEIPINKDYIVVNGEHVQMDTMNVLEFNRTYVPLRFVFQSMGFNVSWWWESGQHIIHIDSP